jgi:predicted glycoside hydrolase/deacetylase ChbG (UPF0249 family)
MEFNEQIARVKKLAGDKLTHLDSHQNSHLHYFPMFLRLAREWKIPCLRTNASLICLEAESPQASRLRVYLRKPHTWLGHLWRQRLMQRASSLGFRMADRLVTVGYAGSGNKAVKENWERCFKNLPVGTFEIYCHPATPDETLRRWAAYCEPRRQELEILRRSEWRDLARQRGIQLVSFHDLAAN